tara:strand:+ start:92 stop:196 length:105 start_codon:yes stop_codon:yes gene_type:complete
LLVEVVEEQSLVEAVEVEVLEREKTLLILIQFLL